MRALGLLALLASSFALFACSSGGGSGGEGGGDAGSDDAGDAGDAAAPLRVCGPAKPCHPDEFCDYPDDMCGAGAIRGICFPAPTKDCASDVMACGCDGTLGVVCQGAIGLGHAVDVGPPGACMAPPGTLACGEFFCDPAAQLCDSETNLMSCVQTYACTAFPSDCSTPTCPCLLMSLQVPTCSGDADGGFTVVGMPADSSTCP